MGASFGAVRANQDQPAPRNGSGSGGSVGRPGHEHGPGPRRSADARGLPPDAAAASTAEGEAGLNHLAAVGAGDFTARRQAAAGAGPPVTRIGAGVAPAGMPTAPPFAPEVTRGGGVAAASGFGGRWKGMGAGIFGESPQGMPPRALGTAGEDVRSSPATAAPIGAGGRTVRSRAGIAAVCRLCLRLGLRGARARCWRAPEPRPAWPARCRSRGRTCSGPGFLCRSGCR